MIPVNTSVVSAVVISKIKGVAKMLMMKRTKGNFWCHVAGSIEGKELAWEAIIREVREETQIQVETLYNAEYLEQFYESDTNRIMIIPAFVVFCDDDQEIFLNEEHTDFKWCTLEEALKLATFPNQKSLYEHIWEHFIKHKPSQLMVINM